MNIERPPLEGSSSQMDGSRASVLGKRRDIIHLCEVYIIKVNKRIKKVSIVYPSWKLFKNLQIV